MTFQLGQKVYVRGDVGTLRFIGKTQFAPGTWYGVELDTKHGKNDGSVNGVKYFECEKKDDGFYGVFVRILLLDTSQRDSTSSGDLALGSPDKVDLSSTVKQLQNKLRVATQEVDQYKSLIEKYVSLHKQALERSTNLESRLESAVVDKEYLEDSKVQLTSQLKELRLKYEELETDYQIIKEEQEINKQIEGEVKKELENTELSQEVQLLISRNKQLELALVNLQKLSKESQTALRDEIQRLNTRIAESEKQFGLSKNSDLKLKEAESNIELLRKQLDSSLELEKIIESLNLKNEELQSELDKLSQEILELTELHDLDRALEENQKIVENELRSTISELKDLINLDKQKLATLAKQNKYLESKLADVPSTTQTPISYTTHDNIELEADFEKLKVDLKNEQRLSFTNSLQKELAVEQLKFNTWSATESRSENSKICSKLVFLKHIVSPLRNHALSVPHGELFYDKTTPSTNHSNLEIVYSLLTFTESMWLYNYSPPRVERLSLICERLELFLNDLKAKFLECNVENMDYRFVQEFIDEISDIFSLEDKDNKIIALGRAQYALAINLISGHVQNFIRLNEYINELLKSVLESGNGTPIELELKENMEFILHVAHKLEGMVKEKTQLIEELEDNVDISKTYNYYAYLEILDLVQKPMDLLLRIVKQIEIEDNTFKDSPNLDQETFERIFETKKGTLDQLVKQFKELEDFLQTELSFQKINNKTWRELENGTTSTGESSNSADVAEHLETIRILSDKSIERENKISDLLVNISLLESTLTSSNTKNSQIIELLRSELKALRAEHEELSKKYTELQDISSHLSEQLKHATELNLTLSKDNVLVPDFEKLEPEHQYNKVMALAQENLILKKLLSQQTTSNSKTDWPLTTLSAKVAPEVEDNIQLMKAKEFYLNANRFRDIAPKVTPIKVNFQKRVINFHRYLVASMNDDIHRFQPAT